MTDQVLRPTGVGLGRVVVRERVLLALRCDGFLFDRDAISRKYLTTQQIIAEHSDVLDHRRWDDPGTQLAWTASALMERRNAALGREQGAVA